MATLQFRGDAVAVAQVTTATPANVEVGDQFILTINGKQVSYTAAAATVADVVAGLAAAVEASEIPEFTEITATDTGTEVTFTADTAGKPFTVTGSTVNGGGSDTQTLTIATTTASAGPNHWDTAANWSTGAVPANGDDVYIEDSDVSILYGLDQSSVTLDSLHVAAGYTGQIGLPRTCTDGSTEYAEYRDRFLAIGASEIQIGGGSGTGSGRIQIDTGSAAADVTVCHTASSVEDNLPAVLWKGTHGSNTLNVHDGSVGAAVLGGETATLATLRHAGGDVGIGSGATLTTVERSGDGQLTIECPATTVNQSSGRTTFAGSGAVGTINLDGGRIEYRSSGTITNAVLDGPDAVLDFSGDLRDRTVTDCTLKRGTILDPHETVTWTNGIAPQTGLTAV